MRLGAALAVVRYNDGYAGINEVFEAVGVTLGAYLSEFTNKIDTARKFEVKVLSVANSESLRKSSGEERKVKSQVRKHGQGYDSGKYSSAQPDVESDAEDITPAPTTSTTLNTVVDSDNEPDPQLPTTSLAVEDTDGSCEICGYTEDEGIVGIGLGITLPAGDILWVECADCFKWFHILCLGIEEEDLSEGDWRCGKC